MKVKFIVIVLILFQACSPKKEKLEVIANRDIQFNKIEIDTLFTKAQEFSEQGFFVLEDHDLLYFDNLYVSALKFNLKGDFIAKIFEGNEFNGVNSILSYQKTAEQKRLVINSHRITAFDDNWEYLYKKNFDWDDGKDDDTRLNNPQADMTSIYELSVGWPPAQNNSLLIDDESILMPIECTHPDFNAYMHEEYYQEAFAFGEFDIKSGKLVRMRGKRSPVYLDHKFIPNFDFYTISNFGEDYLISFAPDSLIWVYDENFQPKTAFGISASSMKQNYPLTKGTEALGTFLEDVSNYGYYTYIYHEPKSELIFRSYFTGEGNEGGLQIYKGDVLIGEFSVPFRFRVFGADGDYFYADGFVDEESHQLGVYKFKLNGK